MEEEVLTPEELAKRWEKDGVTVNTLKHWRERKRLKGPGYRRIANKVVYPLRLVLQYEYEQIVIPGRRRRRNRHA